MSLRSSRLRHFCDGLDRNPSSSGPRTRTAASALYETAHEFADCSERSVGRACRAVRRSGGLHLYLLQGILLPHQQSRCLRQLPRDARAVRCLAQVEPSLGRPPATTAIRRTTLSESTLSRPTTDSGIRSTSPPAGIPTPSRSRSSITRSPRTPAVTATRASPPPSTGTSSTARPRDCLCTRCHFSVGHSESASSTSATRSCRKQS